MLRNDLIRGVLFPGEGDAKGGGERAAVTRCPVSDIGGGAVVAGVTVFANVLWRGREEGVRIIGISAVTFATHDMRRAVTFYRLLEMRLLYGGDEAAFISFAAGDNFLNLIAQPAGRWS